MSPFLKNASVVRCVPFLIAGAACAVMSVFSPLAGYAQNPPPVVPQTKDLVRADEGVTKRAALVIGNTHYAYKPLTNEENDARDMDAALTKLGFVVTRKTDLTLSQMRDAVNAWADTLDSHTLALVYYSGHGVTNNGQNYLVPIDNAAIKNKRDVPQLAYSFQLLVDATHDANCPLSIFILDACRNDPLPKGLKGDDGQKGLVKTDAPIGTYIAYAARNGETAIDDKDGKNSLFTAALLKHIQTPGLPIETLFKRVRASVLQASGSEQHPDESSQLIGDFYFVPALNPVPLSVVVPGNGSVVETKGRLSVSVNVPGATVTVDKEAAPGGEYLLSLLDEAEKAVTVKVTATGYEGQLVNVTMLRGKTVSLPIVLKAAAAPSPAPIRKPTSVAPVSPPPVVAGRKVNPKDGAELILIPAGQFLMGEDKHTVNLPSYSIYKNLVTVAMYEKFCKATKRQMPSAPDFNKRWSKKDHPMVNVSWYDAKAYCDWASASLPSEAQWEKAARGTKGQEFPWGNTFDSGKLWYSKSSDYLLIGTAGTARVGSFPAGASPYGVLDMVGNVEQWCDDWYDASKVCKALRGSDWVSTYASFADSANFPFCRYRNQLTPINSYSYIGFRCVFLSAGRPLPE